MYLQDNAHALNECIYNTMRVRSSGVRGKGNEIGDHDGPGFVLTKTLTMQDKMECDWFKPSKHKVIPLPSTKTFNFKIRNKT